MKLSKLNKRIESLNKIKEIVEISKFDVLQKLNNSIKNRRYHFSMVAKSLEILAFLNTKYNLKNPFVREVRKTNKKVLWVYFTISASVIKVSYSQYEKMILEKINLKDDKVLTIGQEAKNFCIENKLTSFEHFESFKEKTNDIIALLNGVAFSGVFDEIKLVSFSLKTFGLEPQILFPIDVSKAKFNNAELKKIRFYPSINKIVESLSNAFVSNVVHTVFEESYENYYRSKLLQNEESLNNIDQILQNIRIEVNKWKRKKTTSELMHIGQIMKNESGKNE